jgi:hypothetical protein
VVLMDTEALTRQLTDHLHRGGQWVHFQDGGENDGYRTSHWIPVGKPFVPPANWQRDRNIFFTVNPGSHNRRPKSATHNEDIIAANALYAEYDGKDFITKEEWLPNYVRPDLTELPAPKARGALQKAQTAAIDATYKKDPEKYKARAWNHLCAVKPRPNAVWDSGGGYQALWLLRDTVAVDDSNRAYVAHVQREWVHRVGGDPGAFDLRRILRFPGSKNFKKKYAPNYPTVAYQWFEFDRQYDFADLAAMVPPVEARTYTQRRTVHVPDGVSLELGSCGEVPALPYDNGLINAYNEATDLRELLLEIGYTDHRKARMSRPGGDSGGVELMRDNTARIYSSADPLFADGQFRITPAHVFCVYGYNGDVAAMLEGLEAESPAASTLLHDLRKLRTWVQEAGVAAILREHEPKIARPADYIKTLIAIINYAIQRGAPRVRLGSYQLGEMTNNSHMTAKRHLAMFGEGITVKHEKGEKAGTITHRPGLNLVTITDDQDGYGKWVDLTDLLRSVNLLHSQPAEAEVNTSQQFANEHLQDEAFVLYPRHFAVKMRPDAEILPHGLSAAALLIAAVLSEYGELTRTAICQLTGLSQYTVGKMLRRMNDMGLLVVWQGKPYRYDLHPNFEEVLDDLRPLLPSYGIGAKRAKETARARAAFCDHQLEIDSRMPEDREKARLRARRDKYNKAELAYVAAMEDMGLNPWAKLVDRRDTRTIVQDDLGSLTLEELVSLDPDPPKKVSRPHMKIDYGEQWVSVDRPIYEQWQELAPLPYAERYRLLSFADYEREEIDRARRMAGKMGRGPRQFVGVGEPAQEVAA